MIKRDPPGTVSPEIMHRTTTVLLQAGIAPSVNSEALLGSRGEIKILHNGEQYSLRRTRQNKLILTK